MIAASQRRLSVFRAVVETGGFNLAAARLGIAQPSVGAHVKAIEQQLGQPIFSRDRGRKPRLTKAGEALYAYALDLQRLAEETTAALDVMRFSGTREIIIAAHRDLAQSWLPTRLAAFARRNPKLRIVTHTGTIEDVVSLVRDRAAQLGLLMGMGAVAGFHNDLLGHEPLSLVVAPGHALACRATVEPGDLATHPFVTGLRTSQYFQITDAALRKLGLADYDIALELQDFAAVRELARHGAGIACLAASTVRNELRAGSLVALPLARALPPLELRCIYLPPLSEPAAKFAAHLRNAAAG